MSNYHKGPYKVKNTNKYIGTRMPYCRSSWEFMICRLCDNHPSIIEWASEPVKIPYVDPFTGQYTVYVPDFLVMFDDKKGNRRVELWEIKPMSQANLNESKRPKDQLAIVKNAAKWKAAQKWCSKKGITFKVITEESILR